MACQVPVLATFPSPLVPATAVEKKPGGNKKASSEDIVVMPPTRIRLREDMWISSKTFYVLDAEVCTVLL